jgi:hypothetical protein
MTNYKIDILLYVQNGSVKSDCADITFFNQGTTNITLNNGLIIYSGQSINFSANNNEIDRTIYNFYFSTGSGLVNKLIVLRKIYV